jgi:hypothetical protein
MRFRSNIRGKHRQTDQPRIDIGIAEKKTICRVRGITGKMQEGEGSWQQGKMEERESEGNEADGLSAAACWRV